MCKQKNKTIKNEQNTDKINQVRYTGTTGKERRDSRRDRKRMVEMQNGS